MKVIEFKATYAEGQELLLKVTARNIDSGFRKAAKRCLDGIPPSWGSIHSLEFWQVLS